jgi:putative membrane protein
VKIGFALAALAGVVATVLLIVQDGAGGVLQALAKLGWWLVPIAAFHLVPLLLSTAAWNRATAPHCRRSLGTLLALRWIREGINSLLPVAQIGGDAVGARLLSVLGVPPSMAAASVIVDFTIELLTLCLFILLGLGIFIADRPPSPVAGWILVGGAALIVAAIGFAAVQRAGSLRFAQRLLEHGTRQAARLRFPSMRGLHDAVRARYADRRAMACAASLHLLSWLIAAAEIWLVLYVMGARIGVGDALALESLSHAVRAAGFFVPGALGVQEAGFVALGALFGVPPEAALALSLARRARELALGAPALLAWQAIEARRLQRRQTPAPMPTQP